jgi:phosphomannomutase
LGKICSDTGWIDKHIARTLAQKVVNRPAIKKRKFKLVVDAINGAGSNALPELCEQLGAKVVRINCDADGNFVHEPEPIPANLTQLSKAVKKHKADLGLACDPDADRLALVDEHGRPIGEELTLTIAVREVLKKMKGATVINLSTSRVTADMAKAAGSPVYRSKVGEANVVAMMHQKKAVIGGEGNGGVMFPSFHTGRDSLIGAALVLSCLAEEKVTLSALADSFPVYYTAKSKAALPGDFKKRLARLGVDADKLIGRHKIDKRDGLRFDFEAGWLQIRSSNTEPIYRLVVETNNKKLTSELHASIKRYFK